MIIRQAILWIIILTIFICKQKVHCSDLALMPKPQFVKITNNKHFLIDNNTTIFVDSQIINGRDIYLKSLNKLSAVKIRETLSPSKNSINFLLKKNYKKNDLQAYKIVADSNKVEVISSSEIGLFYGLQTLTQLINKQLIPSILIEDFPRFKWRVLHLDVSRHFFDKEFIKRYLDLMSLYKFNVFHWHLTDNEGWRIESKLFPELTANNDGEFYSQSDIKEIIAYAKERGIEIMPEIDIPSHSRALIKTFPELGVTPKSSLLNIAHPKTVSFLEDIFTEIAKLFPYKYIHIGCDETHLHSWLKNPYCVKKLEELNKKSPLALLKWIVDHLQSTLKTQGKNTMAWCEVLDADINKETVIMCWRDNYGWVNGPKKGYKVVVGPSKQTYLNYKEDRYSDSPGHSSYSIQLDTMYNYDPVDESLTDEESKLVLGGGGCTWTEYIRTGNEVEHINFPRAIALSEALWTSKNLKDLKAFKERLKAHYKYMDLFNVNYRIAPPKIKSRTVSFIDTKKIYLENTNHKGQIHYSLDGSKVTIESPKYDNTKGITLTQSCTVKAKVFWGHKKSSYNSFINAIKIAPLKAHNRKLNKEGFSYKVYPFTNTFPIGHNASYSGTTPTLRIPSHLNKYGAFTIIFDFYLKLPETAKYSFKLDSKSKAELFIHGRLQRDSNDNISLEKGLHPVRIIYYCDSPYRFISLRYSYGTEKNKRIKKAMAYQSHGLLAYKVSTNIRSYQNHSLDNIDDYDDSSFFWSAHGLNKKHYVDWLFSTPVNITKFVLKTGENNHDIIKHGVIELYDMNNTLLKTVKTNQGQINRTLSLENVVKIRLKAERQQTEWVKIRDLQIN